jgi:hypothetical protein
VTLKPDKLSKTFLFEIDMDIAMPDVLDMVLKITLSNPGELGSSEYEIPLSFKLKKKKEEEKPKLPLFVLPVVDELEPEEDTSSTSNSAGGAGSFSSWS